MERPSMSREGDATDDVLDLRRRKLLAALTAATGTSVAGCSITVDDDGIEVSPGEEGINDSDGTDGGGDVEPGTGMLTGEAASEELAALETGPGIDRVESTKIGDGYHEYTLVREDGEEIPLDDDVRMKEINERAPDFGDRSEPYHRPDGLPGTESNSLVDVDDLAADASNALGGDSLNLNASTSTPAAVSLKQWQTPLEWQGHRGTCVDFCVVAAMEARLKRQLGREVNLSEQYANHIEKIVSLQDNARNDEYTENNLGIIGGGGVAWSLAVNSQYGIPARDDDETPRYVTKGDFGDVNQNGDDPRYDWTDHTSLTQRAANDYNLAREEITIQIPADLDVTPFPQVALEGAKYGAGSYTYKPSGSSLKDPKYFEKHLANDNEVIISLSMGCIKTDDDGMWHPKSGSCGGGGHCILLVGYDRSGDNEYFVAKNSHHSWEKIHYDAIREGVIYDAAVLKNANVHNGSYVRPDLFLGRWDLTLDGRELTLDIGRLPHFYDVHTGSINSNRDRRIGALFDENGNMYRVNGRLNPLDEISGSVLYNGEWAALLFSVDFDNPHQDYGTLPGPGTVTTHGIMYLHPDDETFVAGHFLPQPPRTGGHKAFYATKDDETPSGYPTFSNFSRNTVYGHYKIRSPVVDGSLLISELNGENLTGEFTDAGGNTYSISGKINSPEGGANDQHVEFTLPSAAGGGTFDGWAHSKDASKISGHFTRNNTRSGMLFVRQAPNSIDIVSPEDGDRVDTTFTVEAQIVGAVGDPLVIWTTRGRYTDADKTIIGRGQKTTVKLPQGEHTIYANYSPPEHDGFVIDDVTVTVSR